MSALLTIAAALLILVAGVVYLGGLCFVSIRIASSPPRAIPAITVDFYEEIAPEPTWGEAWVDFKRWARAAWRARP